MKVSLLSLALVCPLIAGCTGGDGEAETYTVSGEVTLDEKPIPKGEIVFRSAAGTERSYAGPIADGRYSFRSSPGAKRVEISAMEVVEGAVGEPGTPGDPVGADNPADVYRESVPPRYNANSTLTASVTPEGPNEFDFHLTTAESDSAAEPE
jgi:hypothetical protein